MVKFIRSNSWSEARKHLRTDPVMRGLIARCQPCALARRRDYFPFLRKAIFNQQLSGKIAKILFERFCSHFPRRRPTPKRTIQLLAKGEKVRRASGLSRQKTRYLLDLARHFKDGRIPVRRFSRMSDDQIIESLTA